MPQLLSCTLGIPIPLKTMVASRAGVYTLPSCLLGTEANTLEKGRQHGKLKNVYHFALLAGIENGKMSFAYLFIRVN